LADERRIRYSRHCLSRNVREDFGTRACHLATRVTRVCVYNKRSDLAVGSYGCRKGREGRGVARGAARGVASVF